jgi:hypothetical protein
MHGKKVIIDGTEWGIPDGRLASVWEVIRTAMSEEGSWAELELLDAEKRTVYLYVNGKTAKSIVVDPDGDPRPTEWSG